MALNWHGQKGKPAVCKTRIILAFGVIILNLTRINFNS
jgi:hypothetical protein